MAGDPKFEASQSMPDVPYHRYAELLGLKGIFVDDPDQVGAGLGRGAGGGPPGGARSPTPTPNVPPLPPHITLEQAKAFTSTMLEGRPRGGQLLMGTAREVISSILPGRS